MKDYKFIGEAVDRLVTVPMSNWTILKGLPLTETYEAARKKGGGDPMTLRAAQLLNERVGKGDTVLLLSGFVILNWNRPETDLWAWQPWPAVWIWPLAQCLSF